MRAMEPLPRLHNATKWFFFAMASTLALTFVLHGSSLHQGFGRDDGGHLYNATRLNPLTYFFDPVTSSAVSGANVAPWNLLVYDINVTFFGLNPVWHYAHLLVVVWLTALSTWFLLRLWVPDESALIGAFLYIVGSPTLFVSHEEMSGHYLYGLFFSILSTYFLVQAYRGKGWPYAFLSALFFAQALACKELFVALPVILLFLPESTFRLRLKRTSAHLVLLGGYVFWRWLAFEGSLLGPRGAAIHISGAFEQIASIPHLLFGSYWYVVAASLGFILSLRPIKMSAVMFVGILFASLIVPLLAVTSLPGIDAPDRYLYLMWWVLVCLIATLGARFSGKQYAIILSMLVGLIFNQIAVSAPWRQEITASKRMWAEWYSFVLDGRGQSNLILLNDKGYFAQKWNIDGFRAAARRLGFPVNEQGQVISDLEQFKKLQINVPAKFVALDETGYFLRPAQNDQELESWVRQLPPKKAAQNFVFKTLPKLGYWQTGYVENIVTHGDEILISGFLPASTTGQYVMTTTSVPCRADSTEWLSPLGAASTNRTIDGGHIGFRLALVCPQIKKGEALPVICVATNNGGEIIVLDNPASPQCHRLTER